MTRPRSIAILTALLSLVVLSLSIWRMAVRVDTFHENSDKEFYMFKPVNDTDFEFRGRPVRIEDATDAADKPIVNVHYADDQATLRPSKDPIGARPGLQRHEQWLKLLMFVPRRGLSIQEAEAKLASHELEPRLVLVAWNPRPGLDAEGRGLVERSGWTFDLYEFLPDGTLDHHRLRQPESARALARRQREAKQKNLEIPTRRTDELVPGTWQAAAAMHVGKSGGSTPGLGGSQPMWFSDAVPTMGWTLPTASIALMTLVGALAVYFAPPRARG